MSYDQDPARWSTDPEEAPELLRGAFAAGRNESPNRSQMRSLAVKLAAASAGGAVAVGTVKAASAGNTIATAATWSAAKVAGVIALAGSVVAGAVVWRGSEATPASRTKAPIHATERSGEEPAAAIEAPALGAAPQGSTPSAAAQVQQNSAPRVEALPRAEAAQIEAAQTAPAVSAAPASPGATRAQTRRRGASKPSGRTSVAPASARSENARTAPVSASASEAVAPPSEVSLLRSAQVALQSRPREAFQLTQQHRRLYPGGEFAQERDALAIQALMRAGETEQARELAQVFIRSYPSSPHAHRFREAMGIR